MKEKSPKIKNLLFSVTHPILILKAIDRQIAAVQESKSPPRGITIEDFANMSLIEAAKTLRPQNEPHIIWSESDQQRMAKGQLPKSPPQHLNL